MDKLLKEYLEINEHKRFDLKAILFDMDGVLFDSMGAHAKSWQQAMEEFGFKSTTPEDFYFHEGRVAPSTINLIYKHERQRPATDEEADEIYARKSELFIQYNENKTIEGAYEVLKMVKEEGLTPVLVTGSGQSSLLDKLNETFPDIFTPETIVSAFDVEIGKPHPEPFLMGLEKAGNLKPHQAIVIENAPLGVEAATKAGIFTIVVNTGPLSDAVMLEAGANIVFDSMNDLKAQFHNIVSIAKELEI